MTRGFTLVELMVALVVMGLITGLSVLAFRPLQPQAGHALLLGLRAARAGAIRTGQPQVWEEDSVTVRFMPDGSSSGGRITLDGQPFVIDPVTGEIREAR